MEELSGMRILIVVMLSFLLSSMAEGTPLPPSEFPISQDGYLQGRPSLAHDPNHDRFLATWADLRNKPATGFDIYGRLVDARGQAVTGDIPISRARGGQAFSAVAFDSRNNRYLVVWVDWRDAVTRDSDIYGQFVNADGTLHGNDFPIAQGRVSQKYPNVAFDPFHNRFLIAWGDDRNGGVEKIYGRFIGAEGDYLGNEFAIATDGGNHDSPTVVFDSTRKRFFLVWRNVSVLTPSDQQQKAIYGIFVDPERGPDGASFVIAHEPQGCLPPSLYAASFSPEHDTFFVTWTSGRNYYDEVWKDGKYDRQRGLDVYGAFVKADDGRLPEPAFQIASEVDYQEAASVAFDPNHGRFLVVWYDLRRRPAGRNTDIYGRYVSMKGKLSMEFLISEPGAPDLRRFPAISFSPKSDVFLILWEDGRNREKMRRQIFGKLEQTREM
jgi:hypothetical protein